MSIYSLNKHLVPSRARDWDSELVSTWLLPSQCSHSRGRWTHKRGDDEGPTEWVLGVRMRWRPRVGMMGAGSQMGLRDEEVFLHQVGGEEKEQKVPRPEGVDEPR